MKEYFKRFEAFLRKDVGEESQSNDMSVLIRILCIVSSLFYFPEVFIIAYNQNIILCLMTVFGIGMLIGALICSYENQIKLSCGLYCSVTIIISISMSLVLGVTLSFNIMILNTILLVFYSLQVSNSFKRHFATICGFVIFAVNMIYYYIPHIHEPDKISYFILMFLNIFVAVLSLAIIGFSFCHKYMQSEEKILQYNKKLQTMVSTDALTQLWNRRAMNEHLAKLQTEYNRHQKEFSVAIMDIDFFKSVNDTYGHGMGDVVLVHLSEILKSHMEGKGHVARWGGEEFLISFEGVSFEKAISIMENLRIKVEKETFKQDETSLHITITAGIEEFAYRSTLDSLLTKADEKLYKGKTSGRNQVVSSLY